MACGVNSLSLSFLPTSSYIVSRIYLDLSHYYLLHRHVCISKMLSSFLFLYSVSCDITHSQAQQQQEEEVGQFLSISRLLCSYKMLIVTCCVLRAKCIFLLRPTLALACIGMQKQKRCSVTTTHHLIPCP